MGAEGAEIGACRVAAIVMRGCAAHDWRRLGALDAPTALNEGRWRVLRGWAQGLFVIAIIAINLHAQFLDLAGQGVAAPTQQ
jgi:hypothetical protein